MDRNLIGAILGRIILAGCVGLIALTSSQFLWANSTGSVTGKVVFVGDIPQPKKIKVTKDTAKCGSEILVEDLIVSGDGGIKNAVVSIADLKTGAAKVEKNPVLDQKGCVFRPHVLVVPVGASVDILNNDAVLHNFHTYSKKNPPVNKAQPGFKKKMSQSFTQAETIKVNCDAHPWMVGWIVVTDSSHAQATDDSGAFKLTDVPAGTQTIEVWHETLGKVTKTVEVKAGEEAKITLELGKGK